jgi:hypothetical protein
MSLAEIVKSARQKQRSEQKRLDRDGKNYKTDELEVYVDKAICALSLEEFVALIMELKVLPELCTIKLQSGKTVKEQYLEEIVVDNALKSLK